MPSTLDVDRLEFIILAEKAGLNRVPLVLSYSNYGTAVQNIPREFRDAEERCRARGLIDSDGKVAERVWEMIGVFPHASVEYDLRYSREKGTELRAAVSRAGQTAIRTVISDDRIALDPVRASDTIPALASVLPELGPARIQPPLSVDLDEIRAVMADMSRRGDEDPAAVEQGLRSRGASVVEYRKMTQLLDGPRLGLGELGVTVWNSRRKEIRGEQTIRVVDLESGRAAVYNSGNRRMLAGADTGTFNRLLGGLTSETQRRSEW